MCSVCMYGVCVWYIVCVCSVCGMGCVYMCLYGVSMHMWYVDVVYSIVYAMCVV